MHLKAVILAGGSGSRLWPLSRKQLPKQFLSLAHQGESFLDATASRLAPLIDHDDVWVVTGEAHATGEAFSALQGYHTILEPEGRNTAPAIAVAAAALMADGDDPVMVVLPADHVILDQPSFHQALRLACEEAQQGRLVTFGIVPTRPDTGFGYIQAVGDAAVRDVRQFTEKPDLAHATAFVESGEYFWNSGMFVWRASVILSQIRQHLPEVAAVVDDMQHAMAQGERLNAVMKRMFSRMPDISIDYGVLEKAEGIRLVPCDIGWSDVGSWDAVHEISDRDANDNVVQGNVLAVDCCNTLLRSSSRLLAAVDVENLIVVETADAVLVVPRDKSQSVRKIVDRLKADNASEHLEHVTVKRPWGSYTVLEEQQGSGYKMKRIEVLSGARLSLQAHQHRSEHWVVVSGTATVTCGDEVKLVTKNQSTYIPVGKMHRLENRGKIPLVIVEIQVGDYLGEDDIERFDDAYGRAD